jgi:hypothetical protein
MGMGLSRARRCRACRPSRRRRRPGDLVVVRRRGYDHHRGARVGLVLVERGRQVQRLVPQVLLDPVVDDRGEASVDEVDLDRIDVQRPYLVVLREQHRVGQADITRACNGDLHDGTPDRKCR